jgi:D-arabinose 1-dehydrogenase-like Zn-dependent alcohol dehydrogenase
MGGHVTALARDHHAPAFGDLGADRVLGYDATFEQTGSFDVIIDTPVRTSSATGAGSPGRAAWSPSVCRPPPWPRSVCRSFTVPGAFSANPDTALLSDLVRYVASRALRPAVRSVFPLADISAAYQAFSQGGTFGKRVITVTA